MSAILFSLGVPGALALVRAPQAGRFCLGLTGAAILLPPALFVLARQRAPLHGRSRCHVIALSFSAPAPCGPFHRLPETVFRAV
jgi:hypothetical protein